MSDTIKISLELLDQAAQNALSNFIKQGQKADKVTGDLKNTGVNTFNQLAISIGKTISSFDVFVGNVAANVVANAFESIRNSFANVIDEAAGSEQAIKNLNVALSQAGLYTPKASTDLQVFAGALQDVTVYSDEAILSASSYLLNLTSLSKDGIQSATRAAIDLAATLNVDLNSATELITKAINGNMTGFKKMGIEIQSANTDAGRLENVLKALSSQQGAAAAVTNTYAGAIEKAKNQKSELFESVGKILTQSPAYLASIQAQSSIYTSLTQTVTDNTNVIRDLGTAIAITSGVLATAGAAYIAATSLIGLMGVAAVTGTTAFGALGIAASAAWAAISAPATIAVAGVAALTGAVYVLVRNWDSVRIATYEAMAAAIEFSATTTSLISDEASFALFDQAKAYRDQAQAIRESVKASQDKAAQDAINEQVSGEQARIAIQRRTDSEKETVAHNEFLKQSAILNRQEIALIEAEGDLALLEQRASYQNQKALIDGNFDTGRLERFQQEQVNRLMFQQDLDRQELELQIAKQVAQANFESDHLKKMENIRKIYDKGNVSRIQLGVKQELDLEKLKIENQKLLDKEKEQNQRDTFSTIATLSTSNNRHLATIGKAAALTQIAIDGPQAITKALAAFPPPVNAIAATAVAAAIAAQAARVTGLQFEDGGIVPGSSFYGDKVSARVNSGEMVLNRSQQAELFKVANGAGSSFGDSISRTEFFTAIDQIANRPVVVQVNEREFFNIIREQLSLGRNFNY